MNGEMREVNNSLETINAAANAIALADNRLPQSSSSVQKRRRGSWWTIYWCFGSNRQKKRIGHAVLSPETTAEAEAHVEHNLNQAPSGSLPFVAPPSSPASFLNSEPPSITQSPAISVSHSANMYSPRGPASMFTIGPYAHETELVSPPVFSTFNTEPSTAPYTPPPESLQLTTPSSPEVPFARLLGPNHQNAESHQNYPLSQYEFQPYQLHPGSPVGQLISPSSGISNSGTSSPFPDHDFVPRWPYFLELHANNPPMLLNLEKLSPHQLGSQQGSGSLTPDAAVPKSHGGFGRQNSDIAPLTNAFNIWRNDETASDHRVSFEITAEQVVRCVEKKPAALPKVVSTSKYVECIPKGEEDSADLGIDNEPHTGVASDVSQQRVSEDCGDIQRHPSITVGSSKEFIFDNADGGHTGKPTSIGSDWWAKEKVISKDILPSKNWTFFSVMQPASAN